MTEFTPFFAFLRKVFIVAGMIGALEIAAFIIIVLCHISRPYVRYPRKRCHDG